MKKLLCVILVSVAAACAMMSISAEEAYAAAQCESAAIVNGFISPDGDYTTDYSWHERAVIAVNDAGVIIFLAQVIKYLLIALVLCFLFGNRFGLWRWCLFLMGMIGLAEVVLFLMPGAGDILNDFVNMILLFGLQIAATLFFSGRRDSVMPEGSMLLSFAGVGVGFVVMIVEMFKGSFFMNLFSTILGLVGCAVVAWIVYVIFFRSSSDSYSPYRSGNDEDRDWDSDSSSGGSGRSAGDRYRRQDRGQTIHGGTKCCSNCSHRNARGYCNLSDVPVSRLDTCAQFHSKWL